MKLGSTKTKPEKKAEKAAGDMTYVEVRQHFLQIQPLDPEDLVAKGKGLLVNDTQRSYLSRIAKAKGLAYVTIPCATPNCRVAIRLNDSAVKGLALQGGDSDC